MAWYTAKLGGSSVYTFSVAPGIGLACTEVVRGNVTPNVLVARNYKWTLHCRIRADTPAAVITALQTFLSAAVHNRTQPTSLEIEDAGGTDLDQIGDVGVTPADNWEDLRVTSFELQDTPGQLVSGAYFTLGFEARKSFPDANGICEFDQLYESEADEAGSDVRKLSGYIRLAKSSSNTIIGTTAIASQLKLAAPSGWVRTKGSSTLGFNYTYPLYPLLHVVQFVSEVTKNNGVAGATGATKATTGQRVVFIPEKGIKRVVDAAETTGPTDPLAWVEQQQPSSALVSRETFVDVAKKTANGEWKRVESLTSTQKTKVTRTYSLTGGVRRGAVSERLAPTRPEIKRGPWQEHKLSEQLELRSLDARDLASFDLPSPLGTGEDASPWVLIRNDHSLPRVEEDAMDPSQRLWVFVVQREYIWDSEADPLAHPALIGAVFAAKAEVYS